MLLCALKFATMLPPGAFTELGEKFACSPLGRPVALTDTLPVSPPTKVMVNVSVGFVPIGKETVVEEAVIVKLGAATTVRLSVAVSVVEPLVPVTVSGYVPGTAVAEAVKVSVLPAEPVTEAGLKVAVTPAGNPVTVNATALSKPLIALTETPLVAVVPCSTDAPVAERENPGALVAGTCGSAFCTSMVKYELQNVPAEGEFATASVSMLLASVLECVGLQFGSPTVEATPSSAPSLVPAYMLPG